MNEENKKALERAKTKRKTLRALTTKNINKITELLSEDIVENVQLEESIENLMQKAEQIFELDLKIEEFIEDEAELVTEVETNQKYRESIVCTQTRVKKYFRDLETTTVLSKQLKNTSLTDSSAVTPKSGNEKPHVQLPKLHIEPFDGNLEKFQEFWAQFENSIHKNENLSKIDKYNYLKIFLKGPALVSIQGLLVSDSNYDIAIDIIKKRYGRKEILIRTHINNLLQLNPVKSTFQLNKLRELYDSIEIQIRSLQTLGVELKSYGNLLYPILIKLLPDSVALDFNKTMNEDNEIWNVTELLAYLKKEIQSREQTFLFRNTEEVKNENKKFQGNNKISNPKFPPRDWNTKKQNSFPSTSALSAIQEICVFCSDSKHRSEECNKSLSDKIISLRQNGICFLCFRPGHVVRQCTEKLRCICKRRHNKLICSAQNEAADDTNKQTVMNSINEQSSKNSILQTVIARIFYKNKYQRIRLLLDLGSQKTFIMRNLSKKLNLPVTGNEEITIYSFGQSTPKKEKMNKVSFVLGHSFNNKIRIKLEALETEIISGISVGVPNEHIRNLCSNKGIKLSDVSHLKNIDYDLSLLIGADTYWKIVTGRICRISNSLVAVETKFGYAVSGTEFDENSTAVFNVFHSAVQVSKTSEIESLSENVRNMWQLDVLGIDNKSDSSYNYEDDIVFKKFKDTIKFEDNRYTVCLPWNENANELRNNYEIARKRFQSLSRRFERDAEFYKRYEAVINEHLGEGIAEESQCSQVPREYFLPHQAVIRENKDTTKLRVVYDASSHAEDCLSLNDCIETGPSIYPDILQLLIKFRQHKIAFTADVEKAFLQIALDPSDRNAVKFLWKNDDDPKNMKILRMTRVIFGAKSSPFLLGATVKTHIEKYKDKYPKAFNLLNNCLYVDDLIAGVDSEKEAIVETENIKSILNSASFNMRKWVTNHKRLQMIWDGENNSTCSEIKVLGYIWDRNRDVLKIEVRELSKNLNNKASKRELLKLVGHLYDPLGFLNPFCIKARILLQEIWKYGFQWDEDLTHEFCAVLEDWKRDIRSIQEIEIPRHYFDNIPKREARDCQLHCFTDASEKAYGAVIYLRYKHETTVKSQIVVSKARAAPLKKITLPRLELLAALIGARLLKTVQDYLHETPNIVPFFWTDSLIVLHWIKGPAERWKPFIQNRTREIQEKSEPAAWSYCPTKENPADLTTRGVKIKDLRQNKFWFNGPQWLTEEEIYWPKCTIDCDVEKVKSERRKNTKFFQGSCMATRETVLFDIKKFSSLHKILRITAWVMRFLNNARKNGNLSGPLTAEELTKSERYWVRFTQQEFLSNEIDALNAKKPLEQTSRIFSFNPFLDEEKIIRLGGRLQHADLEFSEKHPIILPDNNHLAELIIESNHNKTGHAGVAGTLAQLREKFWLLRGRQKVKSVLRKCLVCQRFRSKPMNQDVAPLPADRVKETFPFETTGIDFAGPLYTKENLKTYIVLFTCAVTRAVHLELTHNLTTRDFLLAFRKFIARRGLCRIVYTDNAQTFKRADKDLQTLWKTINNSEIHEYFGKEGIRWKFIVERAAWWGGFWERLVRSVKTCLKKIIGRACLSIQELEVVLIEVEAILNSRPLTYLFSDSNEPNPLTPSHFLIGRRLLSLPSSNRELNHNASTKEQLTKRYTYKCQIIERVWQRWKKSYLYELRSAHEAKGAKSSPNVREGTTVLVYDDKQPRLLWKMGVIVEQHPGRDDKVRACTVRLPNGNLIRRTVQHLYPLELDLERTVPCPPGPEDVGKRAMEAPPTVKD